MEAHPTMLLSMIMFSEIMFLQIMSILQPIPTMILQSRSAFHSSINFQYQIGILMMECNTDNMCHSIQVREDTLNLPWMNSIDVMYPYLPLMIYTLIVPRHRNRILIKVAR